MHGRGRDRQHCTPLGGILDEIVDDAAHSVNKSIDCIGGQRSHVVDGFEDDQLPGPGSLKDLLATLDYCRSSDLKKASRR